MGKNQLFVKKANTKTNPMEIYRQKMKEKERNKVYIEIFHFTYNLLGKRKEIQIP